MISLRHQTRREAQESIDGPTLRGLVYLAIRKAPDGLTCDEVEILLGLRHQTASARVHELMRCGSIVEQGRKRRTRSGRNAVVWVSKERASND